MAENSQIEWTDHTFNPWRGCVKVSPGCDHCYAETLSKRNPATLGEWGKDANRVIAADAYWKKPEKWEREAEAFYAKHGRRQRVFCASLGDVFENRLDLAAPRLRLLDLIRRTPSLDWLLLTKRPKNVMPLLHKAYMDVCDPDGAGAPYEGLDLMDWLADWQEHGSPPTNIWIGTSVEDQERADQRIPALLRVPAAVRFLSMEPLLGPVDLTLQLEPRLDRHAAGLSDDPLAASMLADAICSGHGSGPMLPSLDWVIVGGENGHGARPMHPEWARSLRDQCAEAGVPFFFKQWGAYAPTYDFDGDLGIELSGEIWSPPFSNSTQMKRVGKHAAGRLLDGTTHDGFPTPITTPLT